MITIEVVSLSRHQLASKIRLLETGPHLYSPALQEAAVGCSLLLLYGAMVRLTAAACSQLWPQGIGSSWENPSPAPAFVGAQLPGDRGWQQKQQALPQPP